MRADIPNSTWQVIEDIDKLFKKLSPYSDYREARSKVNRMTLDIRLRVNKIISTRKKALSKPLVDELHAYIHENKSKIDEAKRCSLLLDEAEKRRKANMIHIDTSFIGEAISNEKCDRYPRWTGD